jgi:hypothetical protein
MKNSKQENIIEYLKKYEDNLFVEWNIWWNQNNLIWYIFILIQDNN